VESAGSNSGRQISGVEAPFLQRSVTETPSASWAEKRLASRSLELKEFRPEHTAATAKLLAAHLGSHEQDWIAATERTYWRNPNLRPAHPTGWVVCSEQDVIGFHGSILHPFQVGDVTVQAAAANSWCVAPECRPLGVGLMLAREFFEQKGADLLFFTTAGDIAAKLFTRWGAWRVPTQNYDEILFWIVDAPRFLTGAVQHLTGSRFAARIVSSTVTISTLLSGGRAKTHTDSSESLESISRDAASAWRSRWELWRSGLTTGVRTPEQFSWRLAGPQKYWLPFRDGNGDLLGYAAARVHRHGDLRRFRIIDIWVDPAQLSVLQQVILTAIQAAKRLRCACVEVCGLSEEYRKVLYALHPHRRKMSHWPYFLFTRDRELKSLLARTENWHPTEYDGDTPFSVAPLDQTL
jgi:hypothetical protein